METASNIITGRGAQLNPFNPFLKHHISNDHHEGIDEYPDPAKETQFLYEQPKTLINKVPSPDIGLEFSMNPYQGCEHGCVYCYARNTHQYWGYSAGLDFEQKIIVKRNAPALLEERFKSKHWEARPIMLSGNTDCYQPVEKKLEITRSMLKVLLKYKNPVGIITKNSMICRDIDILAAMAKERLVQVSISVNSMDEDVRRSLEPRTATYRKRMETIGRLTDAGIPVRVMVAPVIPGLTDHEIPKVLKEAAKYGARGASFILVRLNGALNVIFSDWILKAFPNKAEKVLAQIAECHGGQVNDNRFGLRMTGEGKVAESIKDLFEVSKRKYLSEEKIPSFNMDSFIRPGQTQLSLF